MDQLTQPNTGTTNDRYRAHDRNRGRGQVAGLRWRQADLTVELAARGDCPASRRDAALLALASDCLLRVSEVAAVQLNDISQENDGSGHLAVHRSKSDQEGKGAVLYVGKPTMKRLGAWIDARGNQSGPLFLRIRRGGHVQSGGLSVNTVRAIIKRRARDAGIDGSVSGHSLPPPVLLWPAKNSITGTECATI